MAEWVVREPIQAATAAGLVLYASFRLDFFMFYGLLGVSPEEVGHGYVSTLAQAFVGGVIVFGIIFVTIFLIGMIVAVLSGVTLEMFRRNWHTAALALPITLAAGFTAGWLVVPTTWLSSEPQARTMISVGIALLSWYTFALSFEGVERQLTLERMWSRARFLITPVSASAAIFVLFVLLPLFAREDAKAVIAGHARRGQVAGGLGLPWGADIVYADWVAKSAPPAFATGAKCFMYLGRADGIIVLFDPEDREMHRIPATAVALVSPDIPSCG